MTVGWDDELAHVVHGAVAFGATAADAVRLSGNSTIVLRRALRLAQVDRATTPVAWMEVLDVLDAAIRLAERPGPSTGS